MKKLLLLSIIALLALSSCNKWQHKYPEDPERTKLTPAERLTGKHWKLIKTTFNGIDYTDSVKNTIGDYEIYFSLQEDHDQPVGGLTTDIEGGIGIIWSFYFNQTMLGIQRMMGKNTDYPFVPCFEHVLQYERAYGILQLSENVLKIKFTNSAKDTTIINEFIL